MKKRELIKKGLLASFCAFMMLGDMVEVEAAPMTEVTFDAEYYYNAYPDLQAVIGSDASALYNHYLEYGIKEVLMSNRLKRWETERRWTLFMLSIRE